MGIISMNTYKITTPKEPVTVKAHKVQVTPAGVLLLVENSGELVRAFAREAWLECELQERGSGGYSG